MRSLRVAAPLASFTFASVVLCACGGAPPAPTVSLRMQGAPADATVIVDDRPVGTLAMVAAHGVALPPGPHRVTVSAPGFFPSDQIVEAKDGAPPLRVTVRLVPVPE